MSRGTSFHFDAEVETLVDLDGERRPPAARGLGVAGRLPGRDGDVT